MCLKMFSGPACALKYSLATNTCDFLKMFFPFELFSLPPLAGERHTHTKQTRQEEVAELLIPKVLSNIQHQA